MKIVSLLFSLVVIPASAFAAFVPSTKTPSFYRLSATKTTKEIPESFGRAVECAENFGLCDVDELWKLSNELDSHAGCWFEEGKDLCDKEQQDRENLSELLRTQAQVMLDTEYLKHANIFASDVKDEIDQASREELLTTMDEMGTD